MSEVHKRLQDGQRPRFNEPWEAEAYALVQVLLESHRISPREWASTFGGALREVAVATPDSDDQYYSSLATALERVLVANGTLREVDIAQRIGDWRAAYNRTPHGKPVKLDGVV